MLLSQYMRYVHVNISARVHLLIMLVTWNSCNDLVLWCRLGL